MKADEKVDFENDKGKMEKEKYSHFDFLQKKVDQQLLKASFQNYCEELRLAIDKEKEMEALSGSIDTLVSWMQHDVLNMPGLEPQTRSELFYFVLQELNQLASRHPHRIKQVCTSLKNQKNQLLGFVGVLHEKFQDIADDFVYPIEKTWGMCELQRCEQGSDRYAVRSVPLQDYFQGDFDEVENAVFKALDTTERTSSMVENLHSRLSPYFFLRREIGFGY